MGWEESEEGRNRRPNALLVSFYGNANEPDNGDGGENLGAEKNPDGGKAAAHKYAAELIQTMPLSRLLVVSTQLRKEAREVEAGLHRIVQESYTKFQAAAGVVGEIHTRTSTMEGELDELLLAVQNVATGTEKVNARLAEGRERVEQLEGARRVLQLLRAARNLSQRMRELHWAGRTEEAANRYSQILPSLHRLEKIHVPFHEARVDIDAAAAEIRQEIADQMSAGGAIDPSRAVRLRVQLGDSPDSMKEAYLESSAAKVLTVAPPEEPGFLGASTRIQFFAQAIVPLIAESAQGFHHMFPEEPDFFSTWAWQLVNMALIEPCKLMLAQGSEAASLKGVGLLVEDAKQIKTAATQARKENESNTLLLSLPSVVDKACMMVLSEAFDAIFTMLEARMIQLVDRCLRSERSAFSLLSEFSAEIELANDCGNVLEGVSGYQNRVNGSEATHNAARHVVNHLGTLMIERRSERSARDLLAGALICTLLDKEPHFRKAEPIELRPKLIREYVVRSVMSAAEPLRNLQYAGSADAIAKGFEAKEHLAKNIAEVQEVIDESRQGEVASTSERDRRQLGRRGHVAPEKDLGTLVLGFATNIDFVSVDIVRSILSGFFQSWKEFLRDSTCTSEGVFQIQKECLEIKEIVLSAFPGSNEGLDEAIQAVLNTARRQVTAST